MVPEGCVPRDVVGVSNAHFTVVSITDFEGYLCCVDVIFPGKKVKPGWAIGVGIFANLDKNDVFNNFGFGK